MNSDLAYCLEQFIDDQIQLIDDYLETVKENENVEYHRIEEMKTSSIANRKTQTNQSSHDKDAEIIQRFVEDLLEHAESASSNARDIENYREMLRSEFSEKLDDCLKHVIRLRKLAKPILGSDEFVTQCDETIDYLQQEQKTNESYDKLYKILEPNDHKTVVDDVQNWWDKIYGSDITKIIHSNKRFNPGVGNSDIALVLPRSQMIEYAKKLISARNQELLINSQKHDIVCEFVRQIQSTDDENRQEISEDDLINQLTSGDIDFAMSYAETWLKKRDTSRTQNQEEDSCE
jgi:hypothetical protein